jgi:DNA-binding CsgD family transcriptional regulator
MYRTYCNTRRLNQVQQKLASLQQEINPLGLVALNTAGQVQFISSQAVRYLQRYCNQSTKSYVIPDSLWDWVQYQVSSTKINSNLPKTYLPLRIEQDSKQLVIRLVGQPDDDQYLLLLEEQTRSLLLSLDLLGLSLRETDVLYWVMRGKDNQAIAAELDINVGTVRKHLERIFNKLGVTSRTAAIAKALEKLGFF